jgi:prepilin-type N-terminal cleavage/methylation domain-containing protein/prepilin-type processing-associated H-X9-DG protein
MPGPACKNHRRPAAFTLIELLIVVSIISLLISILLPSMSRARAQAKGVHCLARLKDMGNAIATYENLFNCMPPVTWYPGELELEEGEEGEVTECAEYGWMEIIYTHLYGDAVKYPADFPVQRNVQPGKWGEYFLCRAVGNQDPSSGHYRVYLPAWSAGSYILEPDGVWGEDTRASPYYTAQRERISPRLPLIGDANEFSERGDGFGEDDCSYIDAGEANYVGSDGVRNGNRFSDRHYGGTNYLFQDLHAAWNTRLREDLSEDYDLNGVEDMEVFP